VGVKEKRKDKEDVKRRSGGGVSFESKMKFPFLAEKKPPLRREFDPHLLF